MLLLLFLFSSLSYSQVTVDIDYCNCKDKIDEITPELNGKFERTCAGTLIETGSFINGLKTGEWTTYSKKGTVIRRINYNAGRLDGKSEVFFITGEPRLSANFDDGKQTGKWTWYSSNGGILLSGDYVAGKPVGVWTINDSKGKQPVISYNYDNDEYLKKGKSWLHKNKQIIKNDNTGEYFILFSPANRPAEPSGTAPLGGFKYASDIFIDMLEIPLDYWDTLINYKYKATFNVESDNSSSFSIEIIPDHMPDETPIFPMIVSTNKDSKLKKDEPGELSKKLLSYKLNEALSFTPPWIKGGQAKVEVYVPYVINKIIGFSKLVD